MAVWGSLDSSCHSPSSPPGRVLHHDIRAQNVVWNSAEREYQLRRGAGDGRDVDATLPVSLPTDGGRRSR